MSKYRKKPVVVFAKQKVAAWPNEIEVAGGWCRKNDYDKTKHQNLAMEKIKTFLCNFKSAHLRVMMRYLRKRGWVVFYLEPEHRKCNGVCWLNLYKSQIA